MNLLKFSYFSIGSSIVIGAFAYAWYTNKSAKPPMPARLPKDDTDKETWYLHVTNSKKNIVRQKIEASGMIVQELDIGKITFYIVETEYDKILPFYDLDGVRSIGRNQAISVN